jgi:hypothetical protein
VLKGSLDRRHHRTRHHRSAEPILFLNDSCGYVAPSERRRVGFGHVVPKADRLPARAESPRSAPRDVRSLRVTVPAWALAWLSSEGPQPQSPVGVRRRLAREPR